MRLFLSSENFGNHPDQLTRSAGSIKRVAYIGNAKDYLSTAERVAKVAEHKQQFVDLGFDFAEIDLREYFENSIGQNILDDFGLVWVAGGNTFLLRKAMELSGFDKLLTKKVKDNKIVYGGSSAGSIVVGPTLRGTEHGDDPNIVKQIYDKDVIWDGLGIVDFVVIPHWQSDWSGESSEQMRRALESNKVPHKTLIDGQVTLVNGSKTELLK